MSFCLHLHTIIFIHNVFQGWLNTAFWKVWYQFRSITVKRKIMTKEKTIKFLTKTHVNWQWSLLFILPHTGVMYHLSLTYGSMPVTQQQGSNQRHKQTNNALSHWQSLVRVWVMRYEASGVLRGNSTDRNKRIGEIPLQFFTHSYTTSDTHNLISLSFSKYRNNLQWVFPPCSNKGLFCHQRLYVIKSVINTTPRSWFHSHPYLLAHILSFHWFHMPRHVSLPAALLYRHHLNRSTEPVHTTSQLVRLLCSRRQCSTLEIYSEFSICNFSANIST